MVKGNQSRIETLALTEVHCSGSCSPAGCTDLGKSEGVTFKVDDAVQGPVPDCSLISALASVAWVKQAYLNRYPVYQFKDPDTGVITPITLTSKNMLVDSSGNPVGAQVGINGVVWPLLYEKAYAMWKNVPNWSTTTCPNVCQMPSIFGHKGLISVTRKNAPAPFTINASSQNDNTIANLLNGITDVSKKALYPAVGWTLERSAPGIIASHTYSYLGYYKSSSNVYYIVLRNPCRAEPSSNVLTSGKWPNTATGPVDFANGSDGIFALNFRAITCNLNIGYVQI